MTGKLGKSFALIVPALGASLLVAPSSAIAAPTVDQPNIVVIISDDQREGTMDAMPFVSSQIFDRGVRFVNGMIPTSLCCPSRTSLLTGNYSHTTGVYTDPGVTGDGGGWSDFQDQEGSTLATHLHDAGYYTALSGKYVNGWVDGGANVPAGWDYFASFTGADSGGDAAYYDYKIGGTIPTERHDQAPADYSTDVFAQRAVAAIHAAPAGQPLFIYYAPFGPHAPYTPAPRYEGTWPLEPKLAGLNEEDMSDKSAFLQVPKVDALTQRRIFTKQHEVLGAVDDGAQSIMEAMTPEQQANTLFVYLSDNGYMLGVHRITGKNQPYAASTEVPMGMRWDGQIVPGVRSSRIMPNIDLSATIADAAHAPFPMEGRSFWGSTRTGTLLEGTPGDSPSYCGYRTARFMYVHYDNNQGAELYDYRLDPHELHNRIDRAKYHDTLLTMRTRAQSACTPAPPGFNW